MSKDVGISRRRFLQVLATGSGALLVGIRHLSAESPETPLQLLGEQTHAFGPYIRIEPDNRVIIGARTPDMGQGTRTALPRIIAEELDADWSQVSVIALPLGVENQDGKAHWTLQGQSAGGSTSVPRGWEDLREVGATARWLLLKAAGQRWKLPPAKLGTQDSYVIAPDGRRLSYGALAAAAARLSVPNQRVPSKPADRYRLIGKPAINVDAADIVRGRAQYAIDHWFGDALVAVIARCPYLDGYLEEHDFSDAKAVPDVIDIVELPPPDTAAPLGSVPLAAGVAVLAKNTWAALQARDKLELKWQPRRWAEENSSALDKQARTLLKTPEAGVLMRSDGDFANALKSARHKLEATYRVPFLAHATMEPMNCLVRLESDRAYVVAPTQTPRSAHQIVQRLTGLGPAQIEIHFPRIGGGFGRRLDNDYVAEAVQVAQAAGKPVKLIWTREDDMRHDIYRPLGVHHMSAGFDRKGRIQAWRQQLASTPKYARRGVPQDKMPTSELFPDDPPAGMVENFQLIWHEIESGMPRGNWRAPAHNSNAFAVESFIDEIAHESKRDPLQLRLELLGEPRLLPYSNHGGPVLDTGRLANVLTLAADAIEWTKPRHNGNGLGLACHFTFGGYAAHAFEVSVRGGKLRIHRAICAVDVGRVINPLGVQAQMMGGTIDGLSTTLNLAITVKEGRVVQSNFPDYPLARMAEMPRAVEVIVVPSEAEPGGAGEMGLPSVAPALANAVFAATTVRVRRLPLMPELKRLL